MLRDQGLDDLVVKYLGLGGKPQADMQEWEELVRRVKQPKQLSEIAIVGKYVELHDAYLSIVESLEHAGIANNTDVHIRWINAEDVTDDNAAELLKGVHGVLVPGGFGDRGIEGKISAIRYAREQRIPFFGICLGMQVAVVEYARNIVGLKDANSSEINPSTPYPVIDLLPGSRRHDAPGPVSVQGR
jgi:CTP synthase